MLTPQQPHYSGKVVVLVDEVTLSQAEYTTMAFRASPRTVVVGSTTAGADGNVSQIMLPGGLRTMISGIGVFFPDKRPTQRIGIVPDIEVRPTIAGIRAGRDEVLEAALRQILGIDVPADQIEKEIVALVREKIGPVAAFKLAITVARLPKTRSGKILRGTIKKMADGEPWTMPATIDDPAILDEIGSAMKGRGVGG